MLLLVLHEETISSRMQQERRFDHCHDEISSEKTEYSVWPTPNLDIKNLALCKVFYHIILRFFGNVEKSTGVLLEYWAILSASI